MDLENAPLQFWKNIKNTNCDCSHMQRGLRNLQEYRKYITDPGKVMFFCNNIICKYEYNIDKSLFFVDEPTILSYLKCPVCLKLNVKVMWIHFEMPLLEQYDPQYFFTYNTHTEDRYFNGKLDVYRTDPPPNILSGSILHSHKQYTISLG